MSDWGQSNHWPNASGISSDRTRPAAFTPTGLDWLFLVRAVELGALGFADDGASKRTPKMCRVEAALFVADGALSTKKLSQVATLSSTREARELIDQLNVIYDETETAFRIERVATGYQMLTRPQYAYWLDTLHSRQTDLKLSPPAMETLTVVAYRQPVTRADVEAIRGVQSSEILKQLMERGLVRIAGEDDSLGRPYLYGTTRLFLELFGLRQLDDLPDAADLRVKPKAATDDSGEEPNADESGTEEKADEVSDVADAADNAEASNGAEDADEGEAADAA